MSPFENTLNIMKKIWDSLPILVDEVSGLLLSTFTIGDVTYTMLELLFGVGLSVLLAAKVIKFILA